jgi:hypothetical protein
VEISKLGFSEMPPELLYLSALPQVALTQGNSAMGFTYVMASTEVVAMGL